MRIRSRFITRLAARLAVISMRMLFGTCRVKMIADDMRVNCYKDTGGERFLYSVWHDQILTTVFSGRPQSMAGLVSKHQDGSYLSETLEMVGITPVRGSTSRGGARAMRELLDRAEKLHVCITPDGPRGPRHELKMGIVFLASHSGRSIIPAVYSCKRCWRFQGNWTDMMIPKPFTTIYVCGGMPFHVPSGLDRDELDAYRLKLQDEMNRLEQQADALARGEELPQAETADNAITQNKAA